MDKKKVVAGVTLALLVFLAIPVQASVADLSRPLLGWEAAAVYGGGWLGCSLAIAATLAVTVGAIWITGGAALVVWLVGKGLATAALIEACATIKR